MLAYTVSDNDDWLSCTPPGGTSTGESDEITVQFDSDELPCGQHLATITVSDPAAAYNPRTILVALTVECPPGSCDPWDMNYDEFISIIGDVPPFVDCVYFADCWCPGPGCICPGDCNVSGFLSIVGDLMCFVDCVYFGDCEPAREESRASDPGLFTVGGAVYLDLSDPLGSGLEGVRIRLMPMAVAVPEEIEVAERDDPRAASTADVPAVARPTPRVPLSTISGAWGVSQIDDVPPGRYIVTARLPGYVFEHVQVGVGTGERRVVIDVNAEAEAANQSIQFLAWPEP